MEHNSPALRFSPDGRYLVTGGSGGEVRLWDSTTGREIRRFVGHTQHTDWVVFSPDGRQLATGGKDGTVRLWDVKTAAPLRVFNCGETYVNQIAFSPDGRRLYVVATDGFVRGWDARASRLFLQVGEAKLTALFFGLSPEGRHLYTWSFWESSLRAWDAATGQPLNHLPLPRKPGYCLTFTPDGLRMAMVVLPTAHLGYGVGESSGVIVDVQHGRELLTFRGHTEPLVSLMFDTLGRRLVSGSTDLTTRQWEAFPWQEEEYPEVGGQKTEVGSQKSEHGREETSLPERVRAYADRYWRERLRAEATAKPAPPAEPMVRWDRFLWPKRDERAGPNQIDLTEHYSTRLDALPYPISGYEEADNDLRELAPGTTTLGNVTFDVRGVLLLRRLTMGGYPFRRHWEQHPVQADGIRIGKSFQRLHVFHGVIQALYEGDVGEGTTVGSYILHYADGTRAELPIVMGRHVRHWWAYSDEADPVQPLPEGRVVWTGSNPSAKDAGATLRLYLTSYDNPHPDKEVVSVDYVSAMTLAAPFLAAMTIEP